MLNSKLCSLTPPGWGRGGIVKSMRLALLFGTYQLCQSDGSSGKRSCCWSWSTRKTKCLAMSVRRMLVSTIYNMVVVSSCMRRTLAMAQMNSSDKTLINQNMFSDDLLQEWSSLQSNCFELHAQRILCYTRRAQLCVPAPFASLTLDGLAIVRFAESDVTFKWWRKLFIWET